MRIIGGKFRGKKIFFTKSLITRPLRDFVKENIFNLIIHGKYLKINFDKARILDLYAGTGSFGIECLSRDVNQVSFVEKDPMAFSIIKKNISSLKISNKTNLICSDIKNYIEKYNDKNKFDLIFLDPPYKDKSFIEIMNLIKKKAIFKKNHLIIIHRDKKDKEEINKMFKINFLRNYGRSKIIFGSF